MSWWFAVACTEPFVFPETAYIAESRDSASSATDDGVAVVLVVDLSDSVRVGDPKAVDELREGALRALNLVLPVGGSVHRLGLTGFAQFAVTTGGAAADSERDPLWLPLTTEREAAFTAIQGICDVVEGCADPRYDAPSDDIGDCTNSGIGLAQAANALAADAAERAIVLVGDGLTNCTLPGLAPDDVADDAWRSHQISIWTVDLAQSGDDGFSELVRGRGVHVGAVGPADLPNAVVEATAAVVAAR